MRHFPRGKVGAALAVSSLPRGVQLPRTQLGAVAGGCPLKRLTPLGPRAMVTESLPAIAAPAESQLHSTTLA